MKTIPNLGVSSRLSPWPYRSLCSSIALHIWRFDEDFYSFTGRAGSSSLQVFSSSGDWGDAGSPPRRLLFCRGWGLGMRASEMRLQLTRAGSAVAERRLCCSAACGILPDQRVHPSLLCWRVDSWQPSPREAQDFLIETTVDGFPYPASLHSPSVSPTWKLFACISIPRHTHLHFPRLSPESYCPKGPVHQVCVSELHP